MQTKRPASPSWLDTSAAGCRAKQAAYEDRIQDAPSDPLAHGLDFHRAAESIQRAILDGADSSCVDGILDEMGATVEVRNDIRWWLADGWGDVSNVVGVEVHIAIDEEGEILEFSAERDYKFTRKDAWIRGIIDRLELKYDPDIGMQLLEVYDWKGWSGWKKWQPEVYTLLCLCYARHEGIDIDAVRISSQSYRPTTAPFYVHRVDEFDAIMGQVRGAVDAAHALARLPKTRTRPSDGCKYCPLILDCDAIKAVVESEPPKMILNRDYADIVAHNLGAAEAFVSAAKDSLRGWTEKNGPACAGGRFWGPHSVKRHNVHQPSFWADVIEAVKPLLGTDANEADLIRRLGQIVAPNKTAADAAARRLCPKDREGQEEMKANWFREGYKRQVGWLPEVD